MIGDPRLFCGNANPALAQKIAAAFGTPLGAAKVTKFSDGEVQVEIHENVRGRDVYLIQPTCTPANDTLMELLIMMDACKRASAGRITAVIPYFGYARQDRKVVPRAPITAKLVSDLITTAGADRILTMDLHASQIQGFFDIPVDNLYASPTLARRLRRTLPGDGLIVVSPDAGGVERARGFAKRLNAGLAIIDKRRSGPNQSEVMNLVGDVAGKDAIIFDDMIDTGGTLVKAAIAIKERGAKRVFAAASHGVLSGEAMKRITESPLEMVWVTDTIPLAKPNPKIEVISVAHTFASAIRSIHSDDSVSRLFDGSEED
jgi:ribose-phosphate pyrophosphokinase